MCFLVARVKERPDLIHIVDGLGGAHQIRDNLGGYAYIGLPRVKLPDLGEGVEAYSLSEMLPRARVVVVAYERPHRGYMGSVVCSVSGNPLKPIYVSGGVGGFAASKSLIQITTEAGPDELQIYKYSVKAGLLGMWLLVRELRFTGVKLPNNLKHLKKAFEAAKRKFADGSYSKLYYADWSPH